MPFFIGLHARHYGPRRQVLCRKSLQMALQVGRHLVFGFHHKPQTGAVADLGGYSAQHKRTCKPQRVKQACASAQCVQALLGPSEVIGLFSGCCVQVLP